VMKAVRVRQRTYIQWLATIFMVLVMGLSSDLKRFTFWAVATGLLWGFGVCAAIDAVATGDYNEALVSFALGIGLLAFFIIDWIGISKTIAEADKKLSKTSNETG